MARRTTDDQTKRKRTNGTGRTGTRKKRVAHMPKMSNVCCPEGMSLEEWQNRLRAQQGEKETFAISEVSEKYCPGEYTVSNPVTRSSYKVVYRGKDSMWNFCSCMDFKTSRLGTCKHIEAVRAWIASNRRKTYRIEPPYSSVYVDYRDDRRIRIRIGDDNREQYTALAARYFDDSNVLKEESLMDFGSFLNAARRISEEFRCYDDVLEMIIEKRGRLHREALLREKYTDQVLDRMVSVQLYPYQREGIRFAFKAGKAIIADEMGLGKTVQAIATAEMYLGEGLASSILIVCPTSLKYQWKREIERFSKSGAEVLIVEGTQPKRARMYASDATYKIVSYHTACNDVRILGKLTTDVLIMDEIQRLKNWNTLISRAARKIESQYSVLLSGTPLENKLEELYASLELVDQFCLGPYYLFRHDHILLNPATGGTAGYKGLNEIGNRISGRLIRRTRKGVMLQLPKRSDQTILIPMTQAQADIHAELKWDVSIILRKYEKYHFMTEADRRRLMMLLGQMRMVADSTFILDQDLKKRCDVKVDEVMNLVSDVVENGDEKVVVFSEWERMTRLVAMELEKRGIGFEYFNGSLSAKQRGEMVSHFTENPDSRVFLSTDAGATGLNLQVATTLINMDLPWNPAVLEQRVARIYRLGQEKPVQIINYVSKDSFEESLIGKLKFKSTMAEGVLDGGEDTIFMDDNKFRNLVAEITAAMAELPEQSEEGAGGEEDVMEERGMGMPDGIDVDDDVQDEVHGASTESTETSSSTPESHPEESTTADSHPEHVGEGVGGNRDTDSAQQLIDQGMSFLSGLARTLASPEATRKLVDQIVETDPDTGQASIRIPVSSKETVNQVFSLFQKLLAR